MSDTQARSQPRLETWSQGLRCAIYCRVIDNYGDIGVCWRLARELVKRYGWQVRLVVDDIASWARLTEGASVNLDRQMNLGVEVECWPGVGHSTPMDVVIEAFACELPPVVRGAMVSQLDAPVWINLEYLATEDWAAGCHGLASPQPPLTKFFFFPGLASDVGGVIRESDYARQLTDFSKMEELHRHNSLSVFVFSYPTPALAMLVRAMERSGVQTQLLLPPGTARDELLLNTEICKLESVQIVSLPFSPQTVFDQYLWKSDLNFVRGEDSCVRAQLAGIPWIWQPYRQDEGAHHKKRAELEASFCEDLPLPAAQAWRALQDAWNADVPDELDIENAWKIWLEQRSSLRAASAKWSSKIMSQPDLCHNLLEFVRARRRTDDERSVQVPPTPR